MDDLMNQEETNKDSTTSEDDNLPTARPDKMDDLMNREEIDKEDSDEEEGVCLVWKKDGDGEGDGDDGNEDGDEYDDNDDGSKTMEKSRAPSTT